VDRWQWAAVLAGFGGVMLILRPGAAFDANLLWVLAAVAILTARDIATRRIPPEVDSLRLAVWGFAAIIPGALVLVALQGTVPPTFREQALLGLSIVTGVAAYWAITGALRIGAPGAVTPFRYTRLLFGLVIGIALLGERPDIWTLAGAFVVVAAGLVTLWRAR
jgi:drug/metabolite transporter (DMT)-like permease